MSSPEESAFLENYHRGHQVNKLEPYELVLIRYNDFYAELSKRGYVIAKVRFGSGMNWSCKLSGNFNNKRAFTAISLEKLFEKVVEWMDTRAWEPRHKPDEYQLGFLERHPNLIREDDSFLDEAAVSLGMGTRMLPSNRYESKARSAQNFQP